VQETCVYSATAWDVLTLWHPVEFKGLFTHIKNNPKYNTNSTFFAFAYFSTNVPYFILFLLLMYYVLFNSLVVIYVKICMYYLYKFKFRNTLLMIIIISK